MGNHAVPVAPSAFLFNLFRDTFPFILCHCPFSIDQEAAPSQCRSWLLGRRAGLLSLCVPTRQIMAAEQVIAKGMEALGHRCLSKGSQVGGCITQRAGSLIPVLGGGVWTSPTKPKRKNTSFF